MKITLLPTEFKWKYLEAIGASCALTMLGLYTLGIAEHQYEVAVRTALVPVECLAHSGADSWNRWSALGPERFALSSQGLQYVVVLDTSALSPRCIEEVTTALSRAEIGNKPINVRVQPKGRG